MTVWTAPVLEDVPSETPVFQVPPDVVWDLSPLLGFLINFLMKTIRNACVWDLSPLLGFLINFLMKTIRNACVWAPSVIAKDQNT